MYNNNGNGKLIFKDGTITRDLLYKSHDNNSFTNIDKFKSHELMSVRVNGLIGDGIKATTVLGKLVEENPARKYIFLLSYIDQYYVEGRELVMTDLFSKLIQKDIIIGLFLNCIPQARPITGNQYLFLKRLVGDKILDLCFFNLIISSTSYKTLKRGIPFLGFDKLLTNTKKVSLFRYSGFHKHVPLRHIKEESWLEIEKYLLDKGLEAHLYGHDDEMRTSDGVVDHRKKLTVLETLEHASDSSLCISTTTFLPLYLHHFIPCLVYADPSDINNLVSLWRDNDNYIPIDTRRLDYISFVKDFSTKHFSL